MHRCPVRPGPDDVAVYGRGAASWVAATGGALLLAAFVAAPPGVVGLGVVAAGLAGALAVALVGLRPARSSCSVRRAVMGAFVQMATAAALWVALVS